MFCYIDQPHTPPFRTGLVKTESDFIIRSVELDIGRWTRILFGFLRPDLSPWRYRNRLFLIAFCRLIVLRLNLKVTKRLLHQYHVAHGSVSLQLFLVVWIFATSLGINCFNRWVLSEVHKNYIKEWCLMNSQPTFLLLTYFFTQWIMAILPKVANQITLNHTTL